MEQNRQRGNQDVMDRLIALRGLSDEEISEVSLLKCRIEQQAELICILKQRADEYLKKYMEIENKTENFHSEMADFASKLDNEKKSHDVLKDRFDTLDKNHTEMIKLKDEYKTENEKLRADNGLLKSHNETLFSESINEKDKVIVKLNEDLRELQSQFNEAKQKEKDLERALDDVKRESERQLLDLKCALDEEKTISKENSNEMEAKLVLAQQELSSLKTALEESIMDMRSREETRQFHEQRYLDFQRQTEELTRQLDIEKDRVKVLELKLKKETEANSTNATIRRLSAEIQDAQQLKSKLIREFEAYKKYTSNLLNRERDLNAKLRRLNIP